MQTNSLRSQPKRVQIQKVGLRTAFRRWRGDWSLIGLFGWGLTLAAFVVFFGLPLVWLLLAPSKTDSELLRLGPLTFGSLGNYGRAWTNLAVLNDGIITRWAANSVLYTATSLVISLGVAVPAGYALATRRFAGRRLILWATLITMILPGSALVLPLFLEMNLFRLVNSAWAVILPGAFFPFGTYLSYIFFATSLPKDLLAAGRVDGCSEWQLFRKVALPLARTLLGLLTFLSFTGNWNNYFLPFVMLNNDQLYTLPLGVQVLTSSTSALFPNFGNDYPIKRPEAALLGLILVLPVAIVFLFSQRFVLSGALTGATKE